MVHESEVERKRERGESERGVVHESEVEREREVW